MLLHLTALFLSTVYPSCLQSEDFYRENPMETLGTASAENSGRRGRPTTFEAIEREKGKQVRDRLCNAISNAGLTRPTRTTSAHHDRYNRMIEKESQ